MTSTTRTVLTALAWTFATCSRETFHDAASVADACASVRLDLAGMSPAARFLVYRTAKRLHARASRGEVSLACLTAMALVSETQSVGNALRRELAVAEVPA